jgi:hypothetical protein
LLRPLHGGAATDHLSWLGSYGLVVHGERSCLASARVSITGAPAAFKLPSVRDSGLVSGARFRVVNPGLS